MIPEISNQQFQIVKAASIAIWETYDNTYGYADEKINYITPLRNVGDNWATIIGMFDSINRRKFLELIMSTFDSVSPVVTGSLI